MNNYKSLKQFRIRLLQSLSGGSSSIEVQREELKDQIDKISLAMIDELKAIEDTYAIRIKEFKAESYDLEKEKQILNETFRDVNLLISSINQLEVKQDEAASRLKLNLSEISQLKTFLTESNDFQPNLPFNRDSFGLLSSKNSSTFIFDKNQRFVQESYKLSPINSAFEEVWRNSNVSIMFHDQSFHDSFNMS
jgi:hypothetical protein